MTYAIPKEVPEGWAFCTFTDVTTHHSGNSKLIKGKQFSSPAQDLIPGFSASGQDVWLKHWEHEGVAIIISAVGARCGKCFFARGKWSAIANTHVIWPEANAIDPQFLWWICNDEDFWTKGGSGQQFVKTRASFEKQLCLPPLNEQRRIVEKIEALFEEIDRGVESLRTAQSALDLYRKSLLKSAFEGRLTAEWRTRNPDKLESPEALLARIRTEREARYQAALDEWEQAVAEWRKSGQQGRKPPKPKRPSDVIPEVLEELKALPRLPRDWTYTKLEHLGNLGRGKSRHRPRNDKRLFGGPYPFIQTGEVTGSDRFVTEYRATYSEFGLAQSKLWPKGTLCITIAANIAETAFLAFDACFPDSVVGFFAFEQIVTPKFVELFIKSTRLSIEAGAPATAQKNINLNTLETLVTPLCGMAEQAEIVRILDARLEAADRLSKEIDATLARADALRQSILKKAFAGQLVPQDPTDEPASVLLARIGAERAKAPATRRRRKPTGMAGPLQGPP